MKMKLKYLVIITLLILITSSLSISTVQAFPAEFLTEAPILTASNNDCSLPIPVADGQYGNVKNTDNWARVAVETCPGKLAGIAWSRWPGRDPSSEGLDWQNLTISVEVVDLTDNQTIISFVDHKSNNPREEGVLAYAYEYVLPCNERCHTFELRMRAEMRQAVCNNGSGFAEDAAQGECPCQQLVRVCDSDVTVDPINERHLALAFHVDHYKWNETTGALEFVNSEPIPSHTTEEHDSYIAIKDSNFGCRLGENVNCNGGAEEIYWPMEDQYFFVEFVVSEHGDQGTPETEMVAGPNCLIEYYAEEIPPPGGQYQGFIGPVAFGSSTPYLEPGKEYFDMTQSIMHNVEYLDGTQGDIVHRFNGQEIDGVTTSIFNAGTFRQVESINGRAVASFAEGPTKLIAYRNGVEQARLFQTIFGVDTRWLHPLDQPFEHKYEFELELHGPPGVSDLLIYGDQEFAIRYDENGQSLVNLTYSQPGLVGIYKMTDPEPEVEWLTVDVITGPIDTRQTMFYNFAETGLYHYRLVDGTGQIIAGPSPASSLSFEAQPGATYQAQIVYPVASVFVGLYDDMKFEPPSYWTMPIEARTEHEFEFHLDYHRLNDPDLGNDHRRGDVVVDALYLLNATTSVAQQFPYGRHDGVLPGVNLLGIPDVSMIAFCQRPGTHEVVYWGGWENESYYLPERGIIFDEDIAKTWSDDQRGDCIDAARRVNMELARQGLRTDHTFRHYGEKSQGYQMVQQHIWSPYNLVGMHPPHIGQFLKPGVILPYYEDPADTLFWAWDLDKGGLVDGLEAEALRQYVRSLGPIDYTDFTGIHPAEALNTPDLLGPRPEPPVISTPTPIRTPIAPTPTSIPPIPSPVIPTPTPTAIQPTVTPTPKPPTITATPTLTTGTSDT